MRLNEGVKILEKRFKGFEKELNEVKKLTEEIKKKRIEEIRLKPNKRNSDKAISKLLQFYSGQKTKLNELFKPQTSDFINYLIDKCEKINNAARPKNFRNDILLYFLYTQLEHIAVKLSCLTNTEFTYSNDYKLLCFINAINEYFNECLPKIKKLQTENIESFTNNEFYYIDKILKLNEEIIKKIESGFIGTVNDYIDESEAGLKEKQIKLLLCCNFKKQIDFLYNNVVKDKERKTNRKTN